MSTLGNQRARRIMIMILTVLLTAAMVTPALADGPTNPNCWGTVTSQRASTYHDVGQHVSSQSEPRLGLGNVARLFGFEHVSDLGSFLASVDGLDATQCP